MGSVGSMALGTEVAVRVIGLEVVHSSLVQR